MDKHAVRERPAERKAVQSVYSNYIASTGPCVRHTQNQRLHSTHRQVKSVEENDSVANIWERKLYSRGWRMDDNIWRTSREQ